MRLWSAVALNRRAVGSITSGVQERPRKKSRKRCRIGAEVFVAGRRTYKIFAASWRSWADPGDSPIWTALNTQPKYVASTTLTEARWANTTLLSGDVAAAIGELKAKPAGELQVHGSGALVRWLFDNQHVDEITLLVCPLVVGQEHAAVPRHQPRHSA
jgi:dihydrofolate reductase